MARIPDSEQTIEAMVNCKTYPAVSQKYVETVCTGGVDRDGSFVRLYPIPFRFLDSEEQYKRWDVIRLRAYRDTKDPRPESWHLASGTQIKVVDSITTDRRRWDWMSKTVHDSAASMTENGVTNGCVEIEPLEFYWQPDKKEWTASQRNVIQQGDLFATGEQLQGLADRVPWQFRLKYREKSTGREDDGKVLAWSLYQGFRRVRKQASDDEAALATIAERVRAGIFNPAKTTFAILGTHSRFGHWMISALYHLPTAIIEKDQGQGDLF
ncbi:MAG: hypothetical protein DWQ35_19985 [Planctomycetota bacterium]|nr:MAG: hypothetical protein DWQ35_19985 [Planctomycetota bacterium]REK28396.1 MAG: hypothetical protein DWQ42_05315 [Planctomycetota bacterium]REK48412.1 MAG: hypothetical protein DWQ46_02465 [Planctomycetota bacterium]